MTKLRDLRYESYILLDMKLVVTPERSGLVGRTLRRKAWSREALLRGSWRGWLTPLPASPPD